MEDLEETVAAVYAPEVFYHGRVEHGAAFKGYYITMSRGGWNLQQYAQHMPEGKVGIMKAMAYGVQMIRAIQAVHDLEIIHGNPALSNFILSRRNKGWGALELVGWSAAEELPAFDYGGTRGSRMYSAPALYGQAEYAKVDDIVCIAFNILVLNGYTLPWADKLKENAKTTYHLKDQWMKDMISSFQISPKLV